MVVVLDLIYGRLVAHRVGTPKKMLPRFLYFLPP